MQTPSLSPGNWQAAYYPDHDTYLVTSDGATIAEVTTEPDARAIAALPQFIGLLRDAQLQLYRLSGPALDTYARTFAVLAKNALSAAGF